MDNWNVLRTKDDIDSLMGNFDGFHDSCITGIHYVTGMYVDEKKAMGNNNEKSSLVVTFQSQWSKPITINFIQIKELNINFNEKYFENIFGVDFYIKEDFIYFVVDGDFDEKNFNQEITYIICKKVMYKQD